MISPHLPAVLFQPHGNSLSVERVLNKAIEVIEQATLDDSDASLVILLEDLEILRHCISRD